MPSQNVKPARLQKRRDFIKAAKAGRKWVTPALVVQLYDRRAGQDLGPDDAPDDILSPHATFRDASGDAANQISYIRIGYTASRKVGGAVARNRAKRRMRALVADLPSDYFTYPVDLVFIARPAILTRPFSQLQKDVRYILRKLDFPGAYHV